MITWEKAEEIFDKIQGLAREQAIPAILELVNGKGSEPDPSPLTPSGAVPVYLKPNQKKKRKKKPGCKEGHPGHFRKIPEHIIPSYWCPCCKKRVEAAVTEAMPNDNIGLHTFVLTAWQHYLGGISINYIADMLKKLSRFPISPGGLNQGWIMLARLLKDSLRLGGRRMNFRSRSLTGGKRYFTTGSTISSCKAMPTRTALD